MVNDSRNALIISSDRNSLYNFAGCFLIEQNRMFFLKVISNQFMEN